MGFIEDMLKEEMMKMSPKPDRIPDIVYHATKKEKRGSIEANGLIAHKLFGQVYFCEEKEECLRFVEAPCDIWEVDTRGMDGNLFRMSLDHNRVVYPFDVWAYYGDVEKKYLVGYEEVRE